MCQRDSKEAELFRLAGSQSVAVQADSNRWLASSALGIRLRRVGETPPRLRIEDVADPSISTEI